MFVLFRCFLPFSVLPGLGYPSLPIGDSNCQLTVGVGRGVVSQHAS